MGRENLTAGFWNKMDAKKPDSRKNQAFLELLARFELATSSLPTALEYKNRCIPAFLSCFPWEKVRIPRFYVPLLSIPIYASWVKLWVKQVYTKGRALPSVIQAKNAGRTSVLTPVIASCCLAHVRRVTSSTKLLSLGVAV